MEVGATFPVHAPFAKGTICTFTTASVRIPLKEERNHKLLISAPGASKPATELHRLLFAPARVHNAAPIISRHFVTAV